MSVRKRKTAGAYALIGLLVLVLFWLLFQIWNIARKEEIARHASGEATQELEELEEREATLRKNLYDLSTSRGEDAAMRETFGVALPGEEVIIVVPEEEGEEKEGLSWWRALLGLFGL
jgi:cell division protein FtsB